MNRLFYRRKVLIILFFKPKQPPETGLVRARIEIKRSSRQLRKVRAFVISLETGETVFKSTYETSAKTDFFAYEVASDHIKRFIEQENLILHDKIMTNVELPGVVTSSKKMR